MGKSYVNRDSWGNEYVSHYDDDGNLVGKSYNSEDAWGNKYVVHYDSDGNQIGKSYDTKDFWGNDRVSHFDDQGDLVGRSYDTTDFWGNDQVSHYDRNGSRVGTSYKTTDIFGNEYVSHSGKSPYDAETETKTSANDHSGYGGPVSFGDFLKMILGMAALVIGWKVLKFLFELGKNMLNTVGKLLAVPRAFFFRHYLLITIVLTAAIWISLIYKYVSTKNKNGKVAVGYMLSAVYTAFTVNILLNPASYLLINRQNDLNVFLAITLLLMILYMPYIMTVIWKYSLKALMGEEYQNNKDYFTGLFKLIICVHAITLGILTSSGLFGMLGIELIFCLPLKTSMEHLSK